jgi:hypothetical protein
MYLDYQIVPFAQFHYDLGEMGFGHGPHPARADFWSLVPHGQYASGDGREIVVAYLSSIEAKLALMLSSNSISYYLHVYRRLSPYSIGADKRGTTVALVRGTLEAAIQKYALPGLCSRIAISTEVPAEAIFRGFLFRDKRLWKIYGPSFRRPQLVLTEFGAPELAEFYLAEKLAFEIWKSSAILRALGKGAPLRVFDGSEYFADDRSSDLNGLIESYDTRNLVSDVSATGTVYPPPEDASNSRGTILLPSYNFEHHPWELFRPWMQEAFKLDLSFGDAEQGEAHSNFIWLPFNLLSFYNAHEPFAAAFEQRHGLRLKSAIAVVAALSVRSLYLWSTQQGALIRQWLRAYDGPNRRSERIEAIREALPLALTTVPLGINVDDVEVESAVSFFSWSSETKSDIDLAVAGPHSIFLPSGDSVFIDYAWILQRLYRLFHALKVDDQNFKGDALESLVRRGGSVLPVKPCKGADGSSKQFDAAFDLGDLLLIVECKVKAKSIGWERGDLTAVQERQKFVYEAIRQADDKAIWLSHRAVGRNYDISKYKWVFAVAVTPFPEFIWSKDHYYWLNGTLPRIMTPQELKAGLEDATLATAGRQHPMAMPVKTT